MVTWIDV